MGAYKYMRQSYQKTFATKNPVMRNRLIAWHKEHTLVRVDTPTNIIRARSLGYKATKDFIIVRVRISKGKRVRRRADLGRKPGKNRKEVNPGAPLGYYAEVKASRKFNNLEVVGVYFVGMTGTDKYFEVIMKNCNSGKPRLPEMARLPKDKPEAKPAAKVPLKATAKA